jgi:hypothetical protein
LPARGMVRGCKTKTVGNVGEVRDQNK